MAGLAPTTSFKAVISPQSLSSYYFIPDALSKVNTVALPSSKRGPPGDPQGASPKASQGRPTLPAWQPLTSRSALRACRLPAGHRELRHGAGLGTRCPAAAARLRLQPHSRWVCIIPPVGEGRGGGRVTPGALPPCAPRSAASPPSPDQTSGCRFPVTAAFI